MLHRSTTLSNFESDFVRLLIDFQVSHRWTSNKHFLQAPVNGSYVNKTGYLKTSKGDANNSSKYMIYLSSTLDIQKKNKWRRKSNYLIDPRAEFFCFCLSTKTTSKDLLTALYQVLCYVLAPPWPTAPCPCRSL